MIDRMLRMKAALVGLRTLAVLGMLVAAWAGVATGATAQGESVDIAIYTRESDGRSAFDACYVLVGYSNEGCDENADGKVMFEAIPYGTYTVQQTADLGAGRSVPDFTIQVNGEYLTTGGWQSFFANIVGMPSSSQGQASDVAIATTESGGSATDVCYVLVDFSNEGCDQNGDGQVTFEDVPLGAYTVRQTADLGAGRSVSDFTIQVTGNMQGGLEVFTTTVIDSGAGAPVPAPEPQPSNVLWPELTGAVDIALITRDPDDGRLLTGTCYVLVGYSNEGCDENGDGQVTFDAIPYGTYTVQQTRTPVGYPTISDYDIEVWPLRNLPGGGELEIPLGFVVRQAPEQNAPGTLNVSVILIDASTGEKFVADICVELVGASNVGCDDRLRDGQIDFLDVPSGGPYELRFSNLPAGWQVGTDDQPYSVVIDPQAGTPSNLFAFILLGEGGAGGTGSATTETGAIAVIGGGEAGTTSTGTTPGGTTSTDSASTGVAVELILDTSGSMDERDQGSQTRLEVAKEVTTRLVTETLPEGVPMALRTFSGCSSSLTVPMQPLDPAAAAATIAELRASGDTPIAQSLRAAGGDLDGVTGPKIIVLVTDGEETCGGDPRAEIEALVAQDVDVQVNIVGFAIDDAELTATFQEWARVGNGTYYEASDEIELQQAVTTASQLSFRVIGPLGTVVGEGVVGGDAVTVPVGTWTVEVDTAPITIRENVVVTAQQTTTIDLNATGATGDTGGEATTPDQGENPQVIVPIVPQGGAQAPGDSTGDNTGVDGTEVTETVGDDGFTLMLDGVSVSGASDVAPNGTTVRARLVEQELPEVVSGFADPVGNGVEVTLGDGLQPASPLTITFLPDVVADWEAAPDPTDDLLPVVFASRADGSGVELADAQMLPDGSVVVTADHLSWFQPSRASITGFGEWLDNQISIGLQVRSDRPACVDQRADDLGWEFSGVPDQIIWPCLVGAEEELEVRFQNNSSQVWYVQSDQATAGIPSASSVTGIGLATMASQGIDQRTTAPLVPPDGQVTFWADSSEDPVVFNASLNEPLTIANSVITGASIILPNKKVQAVATAVGRTDCFLDVLATAPNAQGRLEEGEFGSFTGTIIRCVGSVMEGLGGNLISAVASLPGAVISIGETANLHLLGYDEFSITLSRSDPDGSAPSGNTWPTDRDDGPPTLFVWLGANFYGFPNWVACDDARAYCLVGFTGGEHMLVQMSGLVVIGEVADSATDPRQELLALGLPDATVSQILGPQDGGTGGSATTPDQGQSNQVIVPIVPQGGAQGSSGAEEETWTASVQVSLCDAPPNSGIEMNCRAEAGIVVNISLPSGEWLGSCAVGEPQPTPWDTFISTCTVEGMPFNADLVATQDPSTIPAGYEPHEESLFLRVDDLIPGGGDQATFTFFNVRTDAGSTGSAGTSGSADSGEATVLMTFRGCPEGFDANVGDFFVECTIPLDAPDASFLAWGGDGMNITWLDRQYNGEYVFNAGPGTMNLELSGLAPVLRDAYQVVGFDGVNGDTFTVALVDGETREIFVFYYYE